MQENRAVQAERFSLQPWEMANRLLCLLRVFLEVIATAKDAGISGYVRPDEGWTRCWIQPQRSWINDFRLATFWRLGELPCVLRSSPSGVPAPPAGRFLLGKAFQTSKPYQVLFQGEGLSLRGLAKSGKL